MESHKNNGMWDIIPDIKVEKKKVKEEGSLFSAGVSAVIFGAICSAVYPNPLFVFGGYGLGAFSIGYHFLDSVNRKQEKLFRNIDLKNKDEEYPIKLSKRNTDFGAEYRYSLPVGLSLSDIQKKKEAIETFFKHRITLEYDNNKNVLMKVYEKSLEKLYEYDEDLKLAENEIPLGYTHNGLVKVTIDKMVHMLVAGQTDGGKSTCLRLIITWLLTKIDCNVHLIDLKGGVEGRMFRPYVKSFARDPEQGKIIIQKFYNEAERRYEELYKAGYKDFEEYNKRNKKKWSREVLIIDEISVLRDDKNVITDLENCGNLARAAGMHMILATQRPDAKTLSPRIKANCVTTIGMKTKDYINSNIIGVEGLHELRGDGHSILDFRGKDTEMQIIFLDADKARKILKNHFKKEDSQVKFVPKPKENVEDLTFFKRLKG